MNEQTYERIIEQRLTAFGVQTGACVMCGSKGPIISHVSRLGNKEYMLCEACTRRVWQSRVIQA